MTEKIKVSISEGVGECFHSISKNPMISLLLILYIVQSWMMVTKLDTINDTLVNIHKDNAIIQGYIASENASTEKYIDSMERANERLEVIYAIQINKKDQ